MSKNNHVSLIEFPIKNLKEIKQVKAFYQQIFGWTFNDWGDDYIDTHASGLPIGFNADKEHRSVQPLTVIYKDHLEDAKQQVLTAGGTITRDIFSFPGGRRFHFRDPFGHELAIWSDK